MRKFISFILAFVIFAGFAQNTYAAYTDINQSDDCYMSALRLYDLGILSGYEDSTFRPDKSITRAEFTKIVVCMMDKDAEASMTVSSSGFFDVSATNWAAPYINYAVSKDILSGYSDGSFKPDKTISLAEALTILLRTIGYDESVVGYYWPDNYVNAAKSVGITDGIYMQADSPLTRATAAILTDRTLFTKPGNNPSYDTYLETLGYTVLDDALIIDKDTESDNISILAGNLRINNATTYIKKTHMQADTGDMYEYAVVDKNGYLSTLKDYGSTKGIYSETATVNRVTENTIEYTTVDGRKGTYKADDNFVTYYGNSKMTFSSAKGQITNGADITFYGNNDGIWNIAVVGNGSDIDPVLASHDYSSGYDSLEGMHINKTNLTIYKDGEAATLSDIKAHDVVYYNTKTNVMDVYSKKVTGVYYSAYPSKAYVESITVGGKSYEIGYQAATGKLDASGGAFKIGDKITLMLGKNDKIAFVSDSSASFDYFSYGVVLSSNTQIATEGENEGSTEFITKMFMPDGEIHDVVTDKLYKNNSGDFMRISYTEGKAKLTSVNTSNLSKYAGNIDVQNRKIGSSYVLKDAVIIQRTSQDDATEAVCEVLDFDNLTAKSLSQGQLINVVTTNAFGDIAILYVKNLENTYDYGVVTGFEKNNDIVSGYKIFNGEKTSSYMIGDSARISTSLGAGVGFRAQNGSLTGTISLAKVASSSKMDAVEGSRIMLGNEVYNMDDNVLITDITSLTNVRRITVDELSKMKNITQIVGYSDKSLSNGGIIRVLTVKTK